MAKIYYHAVPADWRKEQKYKFLDEHDSVSKIDWTEITPDAKQNWLTVGMEKEFDGFISIGNKEAKAAKQSTVETIFKTYSRGIATGRDAWAYNFQRDDLEKNIERIAEFYNQQLVKRELSDKIGNIDETVDHDDKNIASGWTERRSRFRTSGGEARRTQSVLAWQYAASAKAAAPGSDSIKTPERGGHLFGR